MKHETFGRYADMPLPRYTSYPTAPHFAAMKDGLYGEWLSSLSADAPVSLYLHVPFCRSMCWYCGCHTTITARDEPIARYLQSLQQEIDLVTRAIPSRLKVAHLHFGGGTPTLMKPEQFIALMDELRGRFDLDSDTEVAIEIDPRTLEPQMIGALAEGGVTRASLGVQSFDPVVQRAINRVQSYEETAAAVSGLRHVGIRSVNFDLIYGLPYQNIESCLDTAVEAIELEPDRIAVFGYAHVPDFKRHQRKIDQNALPDGAERHAQAEAIAAALVGADYVRIGLDHYARPEDALARAAIEGSLHRNFQGYTTDACETLLGFGASSIGRLPDGYVQNAVLIGDYQRRIAAKEFAGVKGRAIAPQDRIRGAIIERIMCDYRVDLGDMCARLGGDPEALIGSAPRLDQIVADGIVERQGYVLEVTEPARPLVRVLAAAFDQYLGQVPARHSRAV